MTIERYAYTPSLNEYLVITETTTYGDVRAFCWSYVTVTGDTENVFVEGSPLTVGMRVERGGERYSVARLAENQQLVAAENPIYNIVERGE